VKLLVQNYAPLCDYLQTRLHEPVTLVTAPDFKTFFNRIRNREYPVIITIPNSAYIAWSEYNYIPLLRPLVYTRAVIVVSQNQPLLQPEDLRGKTVAMPDAFITVSMLGLQMLHEAGLQPGKDIYIKYMQNHNEAVNYVITGEVSAAIVSDRALMQMSPSIREKIKVAYTWEKDAVPGVVYLGNPDVPSERLEQISQAILEFARDTPEGKKLLAEWGYGGLKPIGPNEMRELAPYGALLKKALSQEP
jgi:phosphonate transport system substrate-binding protein